MHDSDDLVSLEVGPAMWDRFFTVSPLVVIGTKEESGARGHRLIALAGPRS